jgi:hypothetical protein
VVALAHGPGAGTVPIVIDWVQRSQAAADALRVDFRFVELSLDPAAWDRQIGALATPPGTALTMMESAFLLKQRAVLAEVTLKHRLPSVYAFQETRPGGRAVLVRRDQPLYHRAGRALRVAHSARREARCAAGRAADEVRTRDQPPDEHSHLLCRSHVRSWSAPTC